MIVNLFEISIWDSDRNGANLHLRCAKRGRLLHISNEGVQQVAGFCTPGVQKTFMFLAHHEACLRRCGPTWIGDGSVQAQAALLQSLT
jgi:hypothetical protein